MSTFPAPASPPSTGTIPVLYFDVISPFAYLLDAQLRREPLAIDARPRPLLFAALLDAHGQKGPAEIPAKRRFTYQHCAWLARQLGLPFRMPARHPFNPLPWLRLIIALDSTPAVTSAVFDALFTTGEDPEDGDRVIRLGHDLGLSDPAAAIGDAAVKRTLRANTDAALADAVFGVPTFVIDGHLFWGLDALPMLRDWLAGGRNWPDASIDDAARVLSGTVRKAVR